MAVGNVKGFRVKKGNETGIAKIDTDALLDKVVTKAKLSQPVQTEINKIANKADQDGDYDSLTAGGAKQLLSTVYVDDNEPYNFRTAGGSADIGDRMYEEVVGGSIVFNQLVNTNTSTVTLASDRKYVSKVSDVWEIRVGAGTSLSVAGGTDIVIDLTQMFGSTIADYIYNLEQGTAGAGVAWFRKLFPKPYYEYNAGELMSVKAGSHDTVGFNAWDEETEAGGIQFVDGTVYDLEGALRTKNFIPVVGGMAYHVTTKATIVTANMACFWYDADYNFLYYDRCGNATVNAPSNARYAKFYWSSAYGGTYLHDTSFHLAWDGERNGEYQPYEKHTYPLAELELRGIPRLDANNQLYYDGDTYSSDGTVTRRYGVRAYTSGDESLTNALTDGTNTVYQLTTPTTETADTFVNPQVVNDFGTEEYTDFAVEAGDRDVAIPVGHNSQYMNNLRAKLEMAPDSPSGDGKYIVQQTNGENAYIPYTADGRLDAIEAKLPAPPSANGTYKLTATVTDGNVTYTWTAG